MALRPLSAPTLPVPCSASKAPIATERGLQRMIFCHSLPDSSHKAPVCASDEIGHCKTQNAHGDMSGTERSEER